MHNFSGTDGRHVSVALVGENNGVRPSAFEPCGHGRPTPVQSHDHVTVELAPTANRAPGRRHTDSFSSDIQLIHDFGHNTMDYPMGTPRAIGKRDIGHRIRLLIDNFHIIHSYSSLSPPG